MTLLHFHTPFVLRASISPHGTFQDEGFYVCDDGAIILDTINKIIIVIEQEDAEKMANARLVMPLNKVEALKCKRFRSSGGRFCGGQICFEGIFDRGVKEKVTVKMEMSVFTMLTDALKGVLDG